MVYCTSVLIRGTKGVELTAAGVVGTIGDAALGVGWDEFCSSEGLWADGRKDGPASEGPGRASDETASFGVVFVGLGLGIFVVSFDVFVFVFGVFVVGFGVVVVVVGFPVEIIDATEIDLTIDSVSAAILRCSSLEVHGSADAVCVLLAAISTGLTDGEADADVGAEVGSGSATIGTTGLRTTADIDCRFCAVTTAAAD